MGTRSVIVGFTFVVGTSILCAAASPALAAHSAEISMTDHDPLIQPSFSGAVNGNGFFEPINEPVLTPGLSYLNSITGGANNDATGDVYMQNPKFPPSQTQATYILGLAVQVYRSPFSHTSLLNSSVADTVISDLNSEPGISTGIFPVSIYAFNNVPTQYQSAAQDLAAGEATYGGQPFDILVACTFNPQSQVVPQLYWGFDFSQEGGGNLPPVEYLSITDAGIVPEPTAAPLLVIGGLLLLALRRRPSHSRSAAFF